MSIKYRLHKDTRATSKSFGKWYARSITMGTVTTNELAQIMQDNCTVKRSDIRAVLDELSQTIRLQLQDSKSVRIDGLGTFRIGLSSKGADSAEKFNVKEHVTKLRILFQPETTAIDMNRRSAELLRGCKVSELPLNTVEKTSGQGGSTTPDSGDERP